MASPENTGFGRLPSTSVSCLLSYETPRCIQSFAKYGSLASASGPFCTAIIHRRKIRANPSLYSQFRHFVKTRTPPDTRKQNKMDGRWTLI
ncbi:hypothetical protein CDAR_577041 [Caerostris darwini]|uniref:Uncharacterized protein n=1 Tax=Caerostris darwini TaxID=1538125 RepID=A0AAV4RIP0_9ARAC|nr:hypothetical protein CDAR_577041 [Caerostris darwini]